jgi:hypothetical protein
MAHRRKARWIRKRGKQGGRPTMQYGLFGGELGTGKRLWAWDGYWDDTQEGRSEVMARIEEKSRFFEAQGYRVFPYV